jgi:hypothetical protein
MLHFVLRADGFMVFLACGHHVIDDTRQFMRRGRNRFGIF